jgi:hypothetical protein
VANRHEMKGLVVHSGPSGASHSGETKVFLYRRSVYKPKALAMPISCEIVVTAHVNFYGGELWVVARVRTW